MNFRTYLENDWYGGGIPANVRLGKDVYLDSSYAFAAFTSEQDPGLTLGDFSGAYDRATFVVGTHGCIHVGSYTCLNGTYLICHQQIEIGDHCFLAWGTVITDSSMEVGVDIVSRRETLRRSSAHSDRIYPQFGRPQPVVLEDNVWIGFDAVVLPGTRIGRGSIIGCKTVVRGIVPDHCVLAGSPARIVRRLEPDDTPAARQLAIRDFSRANF